MIKVNSKVPLSFHVTLLDSVEWQLILCIISAIYLWLFSMPADCVLQCLCCEGGRPSLPSIRFFQGLPNMPVDHDIVDGQRHKDNKIREAQSKHGHQFGFV